MNFRLNALPDRRDQRTKAEDAMLKGTLIFSAVVLATAVALNALFGSSHFSLYPFLPILLGTVAIGAIRGKVTCPHCHASQPYMRKPTSLRQMLLGGYSCARCGTEMDRAGHEIGPRRRSGV
jgi:hypothetical protein